MVSGPVGVWGGTLRGWVQRVQRPRGGGPAGQARADRHGDLSKELGFYSQCLGKQGHGEI